MYSLRPIGFLKSPFTFKNGTPRQPSVCQQAKGIITIDKDVFNNPEHSLEGLEEFSHIWIFFIFHKNNNAHTKAKVKPPRLNGKKTGVFSTRSPYRPNNIGLTLAKIECISGACLTVSGIDILDGTPIIDLKPYIPHYDCPANSELRHTMVDEVEDKAIVDSVTAECDDDSGSVNIIDSDSSANSKLDESETNQEDLDIFQDKSMVDVSSNAMIDEQFSDHQATFTDMTRKNDSHFESGDAFCRTSADKYENFDSVFESKLSFTVEGECSTKSEANIITKSDIIGNQQIRNQSEVKNSMSEAVSGTSGECEADSRNKLATAEWVVQSPVSKLEVRLTPSADEQLKLFNCGTQKDCYRLQFLKNFDEAKEAIVNILREDPRSTYRRKHCIDQLYYFTLDCIHVTCWFDDNLVEIVRIKPITQVEKLSGKLPLYSH